MTTKANPENDKYLEFHPIRDGTPDQFHQWFHGKTEKEYYKQLVKEVGLK